MLLADSSVIMMVVEAVAWLVAVKESLAVAPISINIHIIFL